MPQATASGTTDTSALYPSPQLDGSPYVPLPDTHEDGVSIAHAVQTIGVDAQALYQLWQDVTLFPLWQEYVVSVTKLDETRTHWVIGNPDEADGKRVEFDSEITEDIPGKRIAWHSISEDVHQSGAVTFEPSASGRGTQVTLIQQVKINALANASAAAAKRSPRQTVIENLRHFKQLAETGEIPSVKGQPNGPRGASGHVKQVLYGENNPTPPGTGEQP